jgi:hypothetical protein
MGGTGRRHTLSDPQFSLRVMTEYWDRTGHLTCLLGTSASPARIVAAGIVAVISQQMWR